MCRRYDDGPVEHRTGGAQLEESREHPPQRPWSALRRGEPLAQSEIERRSDSRGWERHLWWVPVALFAGVASAWIWATATGGVKLGYLGDEAARLLMSYEYSSPAELAEFLSSRGSWLTIHPPGDFAFKATANMVFDVFITNPERSIRLHKTLSAFSVIGGMALIGLGLAVRVSRLAAAVFVTLAATSAAVIYAAHHALAEGPTVLLIGFAVFLVLREPWDSSSGTIAAAIPVALAGLFRPEAAIVFASLALLPLVRRRWRSALLFGAVAVGPTLALMLATEMLTSDVTYATVRPFAGQDIWLLLTDGRLTRLVWGLGIVPWLGIVLIVTLGVVVTGGRRTHWALPALAVSLAWVFWGFCFLLLIAIGVIHQQERAFVFPVLIGALGIALLAGTIIERTNARWALMWSLVVAVAASSLLAWRGLADLPGRYEDWDRQVPVEAAEVNDYLAAMSAAGGDVLLDWMWWWEWPAGVYASLPGLPSDVCNYLVCTKGSDSVPPAELTADLSAIEVERLAQAWGFVAASSPDHIVMMTDDRYQSWLIAQRRNPQELSSFVRPLLHSDGECYTAHSGLPSARYCPVLINGRYVVLERQE